MTNGRQRQGVRMVGRGGEAWREKRGMKSVAGHLQGEAVTLRRKLQ